MFDVEDPKLAALAWSRLVEPGDQVAGALVAALGPSEALRWLYQVKQQVLAPPEPNPGSMEQLLTVAQGWLARLENLDPVADFQFGERVGAKLILRADAQWPKQFGDLEASEPFCLWVRGALDFAVPAQRSVALVGARAATQYGERVCAEIVTGLVDREFAIVSGGAYGIDAAAHRAALLADGFTLAFLAGGIDRPYPPGNTALLRAVAEKGALVSELPPGSTPFRSRFLARNRLIAALAGATVVVEAAWRSGALSTARHAAALLRPVGAVPGPITSMASGGCHQLIRDGIGTLVTDAAEIAELAGSFSRDAPAVPVGRVEPTDGLTADQKRVYGILPLKNYLDPMALTKTAALPLPTVLAALGILEIKGLAQSKNNAWRRKEIV